MITETHGTQIHCSVAHRPPKIFARDLTDQSINPPAFPAQEDSWAQKSRTYQKFGDCSLVLPGIVVEQVNASVVAIVLDVVAEKERPFEVEIGIVNYIGGAAHATVYAYAQP